MGNSAIIKEVIVNASVWIDDTHVWLKRSGVVVSVVVYRRRSTVVVVEACEAMVPDR